MNGLLADGLALASAVAKGPIKHADVVLCPPATLLQAIAGILQNTLVHLGGQDCHAEAHGAFTGNISAAMLKDAGCGYVILGHSERRQHEKETSALVAKKAAMAHKNGLTVILCIGETEAEYESGKTLDVIKTQLHASLPASATPTNTVIAYEPVWAIGTGKNATTRDIETCHRFILAELKQLPAFKSQLPRILYGGSVKPANAAEILRAESVGGLLVGGASLKADDFLAIIKAAA